MPVTGIDHVNLVTDCREASAASHRHVIGLEPGPRPAFLFPGAWLDAGGRAVVHTALVERRTWDRSLDQVAFAAINVGGTGCRIEASGLAYGAREMPGGPARRLCLPYPDGARIGLDLPAAQA